MILECSGGGERGCSLTETSIMTLNRQIRNLLTTGVCDTEATYGRVLAKLDSGLLLRADDPREHFCIMFLPLDPTSHQVLAVHHKKAGKWLFPGGHIEPGESPIQTLNREVHEEVGLLTQFSETAFPFLVTVTDGIRNVDRECASHYDIWFLLKADCRKFSVGTEEFLESRWVATHQVQTLIDDPACLSAVGRLPNLD